jgi:hypothetical protein
MVMVRSIAEFCADFPDDSIEDEQGFVRFPGRTLADVIAQMCQDMGFDASKPEDGAEQGWAFSLQASKRRYWFQLTHFNQYWTLNSSDVTRYEPTPGDVGHAELLRRIDAAMKADRRFREITWRTPADYAQALHLLGGSSGRTLNAIRTKRRRFGVARRLIAIIAILLVGGLAVVDRSVRPPPSRTGDPQPSLCRYALAPSFCGLLLSTFRR